MSVVQYYMHICFYPAGLPDIKMPDGADLFKVLSKNRWRRILTCGDPGKLKLPQPIIESRQDEGVQAMLYERDHFIRVLRRTQLACVELHDDAVQMRFQILIDCAKLPALLPNGLVKLVQRLASTVGINYVPSERPILYVPEK